MDMSTTTPPPTAFCILASTILIGSSDYVWMDGWMDDLRHTSLIFQLTKPPNRTQSAGKLLLIFLEAG